MKKKMVSILLCAAMLSATLAGCGSKPKETVKQDTKQEEVSSGEAVVDEAEELTIDKITLGEDYKDISATIKVLTHRTDIVDTIFQDYAAEFNKSYPNITIEYEALTDYAEDITVRLVTGEWGDICMVPTTVDKQDLGTYFKSYGNKADLGKIYNFVNEQSHGEDVYGIASTGNAQGIVYNKAVFQKAGVAEIPKTPEEFLGALQQIKDNTDAIPLYSNFAAGWTMGAWDAYLGGSATGNPDFMNRILPHAKDPFSDRGDMTGPYAVYYVLYEATARGLIEDDPTTTDWEGSKGMINDGRVATMVLGSWAVTQMQEAGDHGADIGYMPFPITVDGKQYASAGPDYAYGINANASKENQIASMLYVKWLTEKSNFAYDQGGIPILIGAEYPAVLDSFDGIELVVDSPAIDGEEDLFGDLNNESELGINTDNYPDQAILEAASRKSATLNEIMAEWNAKWSAAQEKFKVEVNQ
ncbi:MAG TPA: extracellular solute-binding protein [Epulopiscium sp.]|nr:extracellular solute-binding protein [Candidatus Epulonipiscium sp.]